MYINNVEEKAFQAIEYRGQVNVIVSHYSLYCLNTYNKGNS